MIAKLFDLSGRAALVTGGSKGLGKAMALGFAQAGADVFISSRHENELQAAAREIRSASTGRVEYAVADMSQRGQADQLAQTAIEALGRIDILVNNAGTNLPQPIDQIRDEDWDNLVELNLSSCMAADAGTGAVHEGATVGPDHSYLVNHGLQLGGRPQCLLGNQKRSCWAWPGPAPTTWGPSASPSTAWPRDPMATDLPMSLLSKEKQDEFARGTALGRWGQPDELAGPALLLASDAGSYITGTCLTVDGGCLAKIF